MRTEILITMLVLLGTVLLYVGTYITIISLMSATGTGAIIALTIISIVLIIICIIVTTLIIILLGMIVWG